MTVEVVLDDDDGVAFIDEAVEDVDESAHVGHVQADGRLLDEVEVALAVAVLAAHSLGDAAARPLVSSVTSLSRWASPPLSVGLGWPSWR